jgi:hypothetical protein
MEESHQEATEKEVERILGLLQTYFREDRKYATKLKTACCIYHPCYFNEVIFI